MRTLKCIFFLLLLISCFGLNTGCSSGSETSLLPPPPFKGSNICKNTCFQPDPKNLDLGIDNEAIFVGPPDNPGKFYLSGSCNEGGYTDSKISWAVREDGTSRGVSSSDVYNLSGRCESGRFMVFIDLEEFGLEKLISSRSERPRRHILELFIRGIDKRGGVTSESSKKVFIDLLPTARLLELY